VPTHTRRDVHLPGIKGKVMAVIGMRRSGKTTFLWQCLADRLKAGTPRDALLYFNFEDERLAEMTAQTVNWNSSWAHDSRALAVLRWSCL
jgi:uncharacterized protein